MAPDEKRDHRILICAKCGAVDGVDSKLLFHRFPLAGARGTARAQTWAEYIYPERDWSSNKELRSLHSKHTVLCSNHFDDSSYTDEKKTKLNIYSIPSGTAHIYERIKKTQTTKDSLQNGDHNYADELQKERFTCNELPKQSKRQTNKKRQSKVLETSQQANAPWNEGTSLCFTSSTHPTDASGVCRPSSPTPETSQLRNKPWNEINSLCFTSTTHPADASSDCWPSSPTPDVGDTSDSPASVKSETIDTSAAEIMKNDGAIEWYHEVAPHVCRVCLRVSNDGDDKAPLLLQGSLTALAHSMLALASDIQISPSDALPKQLCRACADEASRAERFLQQARQTQQRLAGLAPAAVADHVFQSSLFSHYFPSNATTLVPHPAAEDALVSLKFDGENLDIEKFEFSDTVLKKNLQPKKNRVTVSKNYSVEVSTQVLEMLPLSKDRVEFAEPLPTINEVNIDLSDGAESSHDLSPVLKKRRVHAPVYPTTSQKPERNIEEPSFVAAGLRLSGRNSENSTFNKVRIEPTGSCSSRSRRLECAQCGHKTRLKSRLRRHMRTRHDHRRAPRLPISHHHTTLSA